MTTNKQETQLQVLNTTPIKDDLQPLIVLDVQTQDSIQKSIKEPPKILWFLSIFTAFTWGLYNFVYSFMDNRDFATSNLSFSGSLLFSIICQIYVFRKTDGDIHKKFREAFLRSYVDENGVFNRTLAILSTLRTIFFISNYYILIKTIEFGKRAQINIGILTSIFTLAAASNTVVGWLLFKEKLGASRIIGIIIHAKILAVLPQAKFAGKTTILIRFKDRQTQDFSLVYFHLFL
ncbi:UNKNOWN [Stylonychia lemnae]|uniref:Uncharacterized protein n=1 Tax=Stylonychia lemnae TaxID=5949 RepID=A0A078A0G2_STYLE|nr:UNKNOWN [Stylonychia lemnae]|eukprot:CDW75332.1 UNKNOWN [Stylonychia lemnae]